MKKIRVLDTYTANRIAAGEVVERPASIVKELVENSIDAGSTSINIDASGGGIDLIRVRDDGVGISAEDAPVAFARHATSKIQSADDLDCIDTLGFRGEALASIAAVSRVTLRSKQQDAEMGCVLKVNGGQMREVQPAGCPDGTLIQVENLFYNTPARLHFLKNPRTEAAAISDYISRMIMAYPNIAFQLTQNDRTVYHSSGNGELQGALECVYGVDCVQHIKPLSYDDGYIAVSGFAGDAQLARPNRLSQSFYINRRYIKSQKLSFTVQRAYDTRLMSGKYPFCVIFISISGREIDVNVHPNKLDVRFKQEERVTHAVYTAVKQALGFSEIPSFLKQDVQAESREIWSIVTPKREETEESADISDRLNAQTPGGALTLHETPETAIPSFHVPPRESVLPPKAEISSEAIPTFIPRPAGQTTAKPEQTSFSASPYQVIGQLFNCYLIIQQGENAFFIDQHAAHERKLYEQMMKKELHAQSQLLLSPQVETLSAVEYAVLEENLSYFSELGFDVEPFGANTVSIRAVPYIFGAPQAVSFLHETIALLDKKNRCNTAELKRAALIQQACKHAIKAGAVLDETQIRALLDDFQKDGIPLTCPHGRPIMVQMKKTEFERLFKRLV